MRWSLCFYGLTLSLLGLWSAVTAHGLRDENSTVKFTHGSRSSLSSTVYYRIGDGDWVDGDDSLQHWMYQMFLSYAVKGHIALKSIYNDSIIDMVEFVYDSAYNFTGTLVDGTGDTLRSRGSKVLCYTLYLSQYEAAGCGCYGPRDSVCAVYSPTGACGDFPYAKCATGDGGQGGDYYSATIFKATCITSGLAECGVGSTVSYSYGNSSLRSEEGGWVWLVRDGYSSRAIDGFAVIGCSGGEDVVRYSHWACTSIIGALHNGSGACLRDPSAKVVCYTINSVGKNSGCGCYGDHLKCAAYSVNQTCGFFPYGKCIKDAGPNVLDPILAGCTHQSGPKGTLRRSGAETSAPHNTRSQPGQEYPFTCTRVDGNWLPADLAEGPGTRCNINGAEVDVYINPGMCAGNMLTTTWDSDSQCVDTLSFALRWVGKDGQLVSCDGHGSVDVASYDAVATATILSITGQVTCGDTSPTQIVGSEWLAGTWAAEEYHNCIPTIAPYTGVRYIDGLRKVSTIQHIV